MTGTGHTDRLAFWIALILAPVATYLIALTLGDVALYAGFAIILGGIPYLLFGGPLFWWSLRRGLRGPFTLAAVGMIANLASPPLAALLVIVVAGDSDAAGEIALLYFSMGTLFALLWGFAFGVIHGLFTRGTG